MASYSGAYLGSGVTSMPPYGHCDLRGAEEADLSLCWYVCLPHLDCMGRQCDLARHCPDNDTT